MKLKIISVISLLLTVLIYSCESDSSIEFKQYYSSGAVVYQTHCLNCHGASGQGLAMLIPALDDSTFIKANQKQLPCIIGNGINRPIKVSGKVYANAMPPVSLTPIEGGEVITYITNSFGNKLGLTSSDDVAAQLSKCN